MKDAFIVLPCGIVLAVAAITACRFDGNQRGVHRIRRRAAIICAYCLTIVDFFTRDRQRWAAIDKGNIHVSVPAPDVLRCAHLANESSNSACYVQTMSALSAADPIRVYSPPASRRSSTAAICVVIKNETIYLDEWVVRLQLR